MSERSSAAASDPTRPAAGCRSGSRSRWFIEHKRPDSVRARPNAHWYVVATVCIGAFMGQLDASIVTLAFPTLQRDFHASLAAVEWVSLSYLLVLISTVIAVGRMSDMVGRKLVYVWGFALFGLASLGCGLAPSLAVLVVMRMVQALGAAMLQSNSIALISTSTPAADLGKALGVQGAAQALGLAMGPTVGGLLLAVGSWRLIFLVNVPVSLIGFASGWYLLPRSRHLAARVRLDWAGLAMFVPAVSGLLVFLSLGSRDGFLHRIVFSVLLVALATGAAFVFHERRYRGRPLMDLALFGNREYRNCVIGGLLAFLVMFGVMFVVPFLLEDARQTSPAAGRTAADRPSAHARRRRSVRRTRRRSGRPAHAQDRGYGLRGGGDGPDGRPRRAVAARAPDGAGAVRVGLGAFIPANNSSFMASVRAEQAGAASGLINLARGLGTSLGVALTGLCLRCGGLRCGAGQRRPSRARVGGGRLPRRLRDARRLRSARRRAVGAALLAGAGCAAPTGARGAGRTGDGQGQVLRDKRDRRRREHGCADRA